jgi:hypothetical protein
MGVSTFWYLLSFLKDETEPTPTGFHQPVQHCQRDRPLRIKAELALAEMGY